MVSAHFCWLYARDDFTLILFLYVGFCWPVAVNQTNGMLTAVFRLLIQSLAAQNMQRCGHCSDLQTVMISQDMSSRPAFLFVAHQHPR